jgi:DNA polymerase-3 subunit alpha
MQDEKDYYYSDKGIVIIDKSLEKVMKNDLDKLKTFINTPEIIDNYNKQNLLSEYNKLVGKEDINKWSFNSICFYPNQDHELKGIDFDKYNLSHFKDLPEEPLFIEKSCGKRSWRQYDICRICGTVLDRKDNAHLVDILTPDNEVVTLNIPQGMFGFYKQTIDINGQKDENWFSRGTLIMATGYRRGDAFFVKKYKNSIVQHTFTKILNVNTDKTLDLQLERIQEE